MGDRTAGDDATASAPVDQAIRDRILGDLDHTLFVAAGAGSGKTHALVGRIVALVTSGTTTLEHVAAITFTEKAAAELRDRVRVELERWARDAADEPVRRRARAALEEADAAAISTLHAFAQRVLVEHAIEARLPPRVEVLDAVASDVAFDERWREFRDQLLSDPALERTLLLALAHGIQIDHLRHLARAFDDNWDLLEHHVELNPGEPPPLRVAGLLDEVRTLCARSDECTDDTDKYLAHLTTIADAHATASAGLDEVDAVPALAKLAAELGKRGNGRGANWPDLAALKADAHALAERLRAELDRNGRAVVHRLAAAVARFTLAAADARRGEGRLEFHDLLVMARDLLRGPEAPAVHTALHHRYTHLLLDEFQDTDPIQIDLAVRIAAPHAEPEADWTDLEPAPGSLFFVGDPKQSIYRFRRADIGLYLEALDRYRDGALELSANFRTVAPVLSWANHVFGALIRHEPGSQPAYQPLVPVRDDALAGPAVAVLGAAAHDDEPRAAALREREAADVAAVCRAAVEEGWEVRPRGEGPRPAAWGDIAVLLPARTSLPQLEAAFEAAGVPYRAEASSLVYATRTVRDLLATARAVADPNDHLSLLTALRSPLFGCGDDDLFTWRRDGGSWWVHRRVPDGLADHPVGRAMDWLGALHRRVPWMGAGEVLEHIVGERRVLELGFAEGRPRDLWRRIRFVVDQARAWDDVERGSVRGYLEWIRRKAADSARVSEAVLPETDDDSVRILTVHAAKGLEFPIAVVSGTTTQPQRRYAPVEVVWPRHGGRPGYRFSAREKVTTPEFDEFQPIDEQMGHHERIRLLYVACTRARDHLVVSLHRSAATAGREPAKQTAAELLADAAAGADHVEVAFDHHPATATGDDRSTRPDGGDEDDGGGDGDGAALPSVAEWEDRRHLRLAVAGTARTIAATSLGADGSPDTGDDPGLQKRPRDLDLPPWMKGRYGTAVGRAVHGALQTVDLAGGADLEEIVAAQCEAEAVPDRRGDVASLARAALGSAVVREAATRPHWREVYTCAPIGERLLEGYVDLLYRGDDGLVVVDYKTAATADPSELARRVEGYRNQGVAYAVSLARTTGEAVARVVFLFLTPTGAVELELAGLAASVDGLTRHLTGAPSGAGPGG